MAGRKYICADCGFTAWRPYTAPCIGCGSENFKPEGIKKPEPKPCLECGKLFTPNKSCRKVCSEECALARDRRFESDRRRKKQKYGNCKYCGAEFQRRTGTHAVCDRPECQERKRVDRNHDRNYGCGELLGPEFPEMPMRKCHTSGCNEMSYNYWCDACRGVFRVSNGVTGLSGTGELFSGAIIETGLVR